VHLPLPTRTILRLLLLKITCRPLLSSPLPERDFDPTILPPSSAESSPTLVSSSANSLPATPDHLKNNYLSLPPHALLATPSPPTRSDTAVEDFLLPKALTTSSVKPSLSLLKSLSSPQEWLGEIVYILRPFVYGGYILDSCEMITDLQCNSVFVGI
jgi:peroxin-16